MKIYRVTSPAGTNHIVLDDNQRPTAKRFDRILSKLFGMDTPVTSYAQITRAEARRIRVADAERPSFVRSVAWWADRAKSGDIVADSELP